MKTLIGSLISAFALAACSTSPVQHHVADDEPCAVQTECTVWDGQDQCVVKEVVAWDRDCQSKLVGNSR